MYLKVTEKIKNVYKKATRLQSRLLLEYCLLTSLTYQYLKYTNIKRSG